MHTAEVRVPMEPGNANQRPTRTGWILGSMLVLALIAAWVSGLLDFDPAQSPQQRERVDSSTGLEATRGATVQAPDASTSTVRTPIEIFDPLADFPSEERAAVRAMIAEKPDDAIRRWIGHRTAIVECYILAVGRNYVSARALIDVKELGLRRGKRFEMIDNAERIADEHGVRNVVDGLAVGEVRILVVRRIGHRLVILHAGRMRRHDDLDAITQGCSFAPARKYIGRIGYSVIKAKVLTSAEVKRVASGSSFEGLERMDLELADVLWSSQGLKAAETLRVANALNGVTDPFLLPASGVSFGAAAGTGQVFILVIKHPGLWVPPNFVVCGIAE